MIGKVRRWRFVLYVGALAIISSCCVYLSLSTVQPVAVANERCNQKELKPLFLLERTATGPGEEGAPLQFNVNELSQRERLVYLALLRKHDLNRFASDMISVHRTLPRDVPHSSCRSLQYPSSLPRASVVIPFRDEVRSLLLRTVHSVVERSPPHLLAEVLLIDDGSVEEDLGGSLEVYLRHVPKVKLRRLYVTQGLMVARQTGVDMATSDVIIVMDSHCEVGPGWLEPLLWRLVEQPRALLLPALHSIRPDTLQFFSLHPGDLNYSPGFNFFFNQMFLPLRQRALQARLKNATRPFRAINIQGSTFAMRKDFFQQLGGFDRGMKMWGGEQFELSFRVAMCGGRVEMVPCSAVGHLYRRAIPWYRMGGWDWEQYNLHRMAAVWLGELAPTVLTMIGNASLENVTWGDTADRVAIRERNNCTSFIELLESLREMYPIYIPVGQRATGTITHVITRRCLDLPDVTVGTSVCRYRGHSEYWEWTGDRELRHGQFCLTMGVNSMVEPVLCSEYRLILWDYTPDDELVHVKSGMCLDLKDNHEVFLGKCTKEKRQRWYMKRLPLSSGGS